MITLLNCYMAKLLKNPSSLRGAERRGNLESKMRNNLLNQGFTLIELLVVISLVGMVMVATVGLLFSVIRASRKSESQNRVKQAGSHTLELLSSMIRDAQEITSNCSGGSSGSIQIKNPDGLETTLECDEANGRISSSSADTVYLINQDAGFDLSGCSFTCTAGTGNAPDSVEIEFTLGLGETPDTQASATFTTTASLRSY